MIKIILKDSLNTEYTLCHGPARVLGQHVGPDRTFADDLILVNPIKRLGAAWAKQEGRGNQEVKTSFSVHVEFATIHEAFMYAFKYRLNIPREGSIIIVVRENNIDFSATITNAIITSIPCEAIGVSCKITYNITGGQIT
jgi:hypothetical protein